jgi:putative ABC transport system ATP-binding protein
MLQIEKISKDFRSGRGHIRALTDVSFVLETGKTTVVVGKSGSGKTTLLNCIGGLERPQKGAVICFGTDIYSLSAKNLSLFLRQNIGFVFQHGNLLSYLTVFENIAFPLRLNGIDGKQKQLRVKEMLEQIGLSDAGAALPHELSGGEIQRVSVARAIVHSPGLLLADEPTASLDSVTGKNLVKLMFELSRYQKCTMVISTHDPDISELANQIVQITDGRIIKETA